MVIYAKEHGRNQAAKHFDLDRNMVGRWVTASTSWTNETNEKSKRVHLKNYPMTTQY